MQKIGPRNALTDVAGVLVGSAADETVRTGVTVILLPDRAVAGVAVAGGGPGTRETDLLSPDTLVDAIDAITLSGGSVYGLNAADAVVAELGAQGRGYVIAPGLKTAPIVPGAILFDLANGGDKDWGSDPPYARLARTALAGAGLEVALGNAGAGRGARAGALKGGQGSASVVTSDGLTVGALACVNSIGSLIVPGTRSFWAGALEHAGEFGGLGQQAARGVAGEDWGLAKASGAPRENTTLAVVATDAVLSKAECRRLAVMAQAGLARAIRPIFTPFDGDVVFALATGKQPLNPGMPRWAEVSRLGSMAADCLARAVARGVWAAEPIDAIPAWRDLT